jgi:polyhydroxybutyrate depolymerase
VLEKSATAPGVAAAIAAVLLLSACESPAQRAVFVEPATSRIYQVLSRKGHDFHRPSPALFVLHPYATDPSVLLRNYDLVRRAALERGWLLLVPQGVADKEGRLSWNASAACCGAGAAGPDDVGYLRSVLADVRRHAAVDPLRVYAFGESNGGFMAHRWACEPGGELRAIASIAGAAPGPEDPPCAPAGPVSVLEVHGDRDERVRYEGGRSLRGRYPGARETIERWRALDGCAPVARSARETRLLFFAPLRVDAFACPSAAVELWTVEGGGHQLRSLRLWSERMIDFLAATR